MLYSYWQLKTIVCVLFLASCLGQEPFRGCGHDYYERSVDRRTSDRNNLSVSNCFRKDDLERKESEPPKIDQQFDRIEEIDKRHADRHAHRNHQLPEETRREISKRVEEQTKSDVTTYLNHKSVEGRNQYVIGSLRVSHEQHQNLKELNEHADTTRELLDRDENLRHLNKRRTERSLEENREEIRQLSEEFDAHITERDLSIRQLDDRDIGSRSGVPREPERIDERIVQRQLELTLGCYNNKQDRIEPHGTLRRTEDRKANCDASRHSDDAHEFQRIDGQDARIRRNRNEERHEISRRLLEQEDEREVSRRSELDHTDRYDQRDINRRSQRIVEKLSQNERESNQRHNENKVEHDSRRAVNKRFDKGSESDHLVEKLYENDRSRRNEHVTQVYINGRSESNIEKRQDTLRRLEVAPGSQRIIERRFLNERDSMQQHDGNKREREDHSEYSRKFDDREAHRDIIIRTEENYKERNNKRQQLSQRNHEPSKHREHNKRERKLAGDTRNSLRRVERMPVNEGKHDANEEARIGRHETLRQLDDREIQNYLSRRSDVTRGFQRGSERLSQRGYESIQQRDANNIYRLKQLEAPRRFEDHKVHGNDNRHLKDKREEPRDTLRRFDDREEEHVDSGRSSDTRNLERLDGRFSRRERESIQHRNENMRERVHRPLERRNEAQLDLSKRLESDHHESLGRFDYRNSQHDVSKHLDDARKARYQISRLLDEQEVDQRLDVVRFTQRINEQISQRVRESIQRREEERHNTLRRFDDRNTESDTISRLEDIRESVRNGKRLNAIRRVDDKHNQRLHQMEREPEHTFILKQNNDNANYRNKRLIVEDYTEKPTSFFKKSYILLGQGTILAYVIMKTLNGKHDLKNQLAIGLREAVEIIGF